MANKVTLEQFAIYKAYLNAFSGGSGTIVLEDLKKSFGDRSSYRRDPYDTAFHEGQRDVYLRITGILEIAKDMEIIKEEE